MSKYIQSLRERGNQEDLDTLTQFAEFGYAISKLPLDGRNIQILRSEDKNYINVEDLRGSYTTAIGRNIIEAIENIVPNINHAYHEDKGYEFFRRRMKKLQEVE